MSNGGYRSYSFESVAAIRYFSDQPESAYEEPKVLELAFWLMWSLRDRWI